MDHSASGRGLRIPYLSIFRPGATGKLQLVLLDRKLQRFATHWREGREELCRAELSLPCPACLAGHTARVSVYTLAFLYPSRQLGIAHITDGAFRCCDDLQRFAANARGLRLTLQRRNGGKGGVRASVGLERWPAADLPAVGNWTQSALFRLWRVPAEVMPEQPDDRDDPPDDDPPEQPAGCGWNEQPQPAHNGHSGATQNGQAKPAMPTLGELFRMPNRGPYSDRN